MRKPRSRANRPRSVVSWLGLVSALLSLLFVALESYWGGEDGDVVSVADGDTLTLISKGERIKVRLGEIDAPEKAQPFGEAAFVSLRELCLGKKARVSRERKDRYGRTVGQVLCDEVDVSRTQLERGLAWVYDDYVKDKSLYRLQSKARELKKGLWADPHPVPPWTFRKEKRS